MKLPDVGEGVAEAELVEWMVAVGDRVTTDTVIAEVLTDKASVEISAPVDGAVAELHGEPGDVLAVGSVLIGIDTDEQPPAEVEAVTPPEPEPERKAPEPAPPRSPKAIAAPAVRARAKELGVDLATVAGTGPDGRVMHHDLDGAVGTTTGPATTPQRGRASPDGRATPVRGVRRQIASRLSTAWQEIPHITYVEEVDVTELERLRAELNLQSDRRGVRLTVLPFLARAMVIAAAEQPGLNAHYDHGNDLLTTFDAVHIGIATQTDDGLRVPVARHCEALGIWELAAEISRIADAARDRSASREELSGSTITITSLGAMGGIATTPIINRPEVSIIGVNKIATRPLWIDGAFQPRKVMNLSSSFDHRMVDGWDAARFVQNLKRLLETPALLFVSDD